MESIKTFNSKDAILLAAMCFQTYELLEQGNLTLPNGFRHLLTIRAIAGVEDKKEEVFGFMAESNDNIIVAFRGTGTTGDFESDLDVFQVPYLFARQGGKTHRGATCIYNSTRNHLINALEKLSSRKKLYITGHSLGGAIATLFALDAALNTPFKNPIVYTLASFRVGDPDFVSRFDKDIKTSIRIYNVHDLIPLNFVNSVYPPPFTKNGLMYKHVKGKFPVNFQLNNTLRNHSISCYFYNLAEKNRTFAQSLCKANPGFCPDSSNCQFFQGSCGESIS